MTVKEFLKAGRGLNVEILELTEARLKAFNAQYGAEIEKRIRELNEYRQQMIEIINRVENTTYRALLIAYYINGETWEQVAADLRYSLRTIHKLHNKALLECILPPGIEGQQK